MELSLSRAWWMLVLRGIVGIVFGFVAFWAPFATMRALILLFGIYALVDGIFAIFVALRARAFRDQWWTFLVGGILSIVIAFAVFLMPDVTALVLVAIAAAWAIVTGMLEMAAAIRLRRVIEHEWCLGLSGIFTILYGIALASFPVAGAVWFVFLIGAYAMLFGALMVILGFRLRRRINDTIPMHPRAA